MEITKTILTQNPCYIHEITLDEAVIDEETLKETGEIRKGFTTSYVTAGADYDFEQNERQIYATEVE